MSTVEVREDTGDEFRWATITSVFDENGVLTERFTENDDGTTKTEGFVEGVRRFIEESDVNPDGSPSDARPWELRGREFDESGQLLSSYELRDDGVEIIKDYENGQIRFVSESDINPDGSQSDARPWELRGKEYDDNGQLLSTYELRDDGVEIIKDYENGQIRFVSESDINPDGSQSDARIWQLRGQEYDDNGQLLSSIEIRDDGVEILKEYDDGQLRFVGETDLNPDGSPSDARPWEVRTTEFDENGQKLESFELRDNGVTVSTLFENGVRSARIMEDRDEFGNMTDAEAWDTFIFIYDDTGTLEARQAVFDDGDITVNLYENGQNAVRLQIDGDNDKSWYLRETLYDDTGSVSDVNTYATIDDVPPQYDFLNDDLVFTV